MKILQILLKRNQIEDVRVYNISGGERAGSILSKSRLKSSSLDAGNSSFHVLILYSAG